MSLTSFVNFEGPDFLAFIGCAAAGVFAGSFAPSVSGISLYVTVLVSYHFFLAWLVFFSNTSFTFTGGARKDAGIALRLSQTLLTHTACLAVILCTLATALQKLAQLHAAVDDPGADADIVYQVTKVICGAMAGLAIFERRWLFSAEPSAQPAALGEASLSPGLEAATADDLRDWHIYLKKAKPGSRRPGASLKTEYERWLLARQRSRNAQRQQDSQCTEAPDTA